MRKLQIIKAFINDIYSKPRSKNYPTDKLTYNHIDEIWRSDLADVSDYKSSIKKDIDIYSL